MARQPIKYSNGRVPDSRIGVPGFSEERDVFGLVGRAGIGSTEFVADYNLDVRGDFKATRIIDVDGSDGEFAYFLTRDIDGLRWVAAPPFDTNSIFIAEDGDILGVTSFTGINIISDQLLGISSNPINPNLADIRLDPRWIRDRSGESADEETAGIYTTRKVGIGSTIPRYSLDVIGDTNIDGDLNVTGVLTALSIDGNSGDFSDIVVDTLFVNGVSTFVGPSTFFDGISVASTGAGTIQVGSLTTITSGIISTRTVDANFVNVFDYETVQFRSLGIATFTGIGITVNQANVGVLTVRDFLDVDAGIATFSEDTTVQVGGLTTIRSGIVSTKIVDAEFVNVKDYTTIRLDVTGIATAQALNVLGAGLTVAGVTTTFGLIATSAFIETGDFQTLQAVTGVVTDLSGTNAYYSVGDLQTLQAVSGVVTDISGTNAYYDVVDAQTLQGVAGVVTTLTSTDVTVQGGLRVNGFATITQDLTVTGDVSIGGTLTYEDVRNVDSIGLVTARVGLNIGNPAIGIAVTISSDGNGDFTGIVTALKFVGETVEAQTLQAVSGVVTDLSGTNAYYSVGDLQTLQAVAGVVTDLSGTNAYYDVVDAQTLQGVAGVVTDLSGTNVFYTTGDFQTLNAVSGVVTDLSGTNAYYSVGDFQTLNAVSGVVTDLSGTNAYYSVVDAQTLNAVAGVVTDISGTNAYYSVGDLQTLQAVAGVVTDLSGTNAYYTTGDLQTLNAVTGVITNFTGGLASVDQLNSTGVVTASRFDGTADDRFTGLSSNFNAAVGLSSAGTYVGGAFTNLNFSGTNLVVTVDPEPGNITQGNINILRVAGADEAEVAISVIGGIASVTTLDVSGISTLTGQVLVENDISVAGVITATNFIGAADDRFTGLSSNFNAAIGILSAGTYVGGAFTQLNFSGTNLEVTVDPEPGDITQANINILRVATADDAETAFNVIGGIASVTTLDVSGISTLTGQVLVEGDVNVLGVVTANAFNGNINAGVGTITDLNGTNAYYSVVDVQTLQAVSGVVTDLSGTNAYYSVVDTQTLQGVSGVVTDISGTNAYYTTGDLQTLQAVTGVVTDLRTTNTFSTVTDTQELYAVTGVITNFTGGLATVDQLNSTGVITATNFIGAADDRFTGLSSNFNGAIGILSSNNYVSGVITQINFTGINLDVSVTVPPDNLTQADVDILRVSGANEADFARLSGVATSVIGGIASVTALDVVGLTTLTGQVLVEGDVNVLGVVTSNAFNGNINAGVGTITDLNGTNVYYNVGDFQTLQAPTGVITDLSGTNAYYSVVDAQTLNAVAGVVTDISGTNAFYDVVDAQTLNAVSGVITSLTIGNSLFVDVINTQELYAVTGVITDFTAGIVSTNNLFVTGPSTFEGSVQMPSLTVDGNGAVGGNLEVTGITTFNQLNLNDLVVNGVTTTRGLAATDAYIEVGDFQTLNAVAGVVTDISGTNAYYTLGDFQTLQAPVGFITTLTVTDFTVGGAITATRFDGDRITTDTAEFTDLNVTGITTLNITNATNINVSGSATVAGDLTVGGVLTYEDVTNVDSIGLVTARVGLNVGPSGGAVITLDNSGQANFTGIVTAPNLKVTNSGFFNLVDTQTLQAVAGVITDLSGTNAYYSVVDAQTLQAPTGVVTNLSGTNAYYSVVDAQTLQAVSGVVTDLSGTNAYYSVVDAQTLQGVAGVVTDLSGTNAYYSVGDLQTLQAVAGVVTDLSGTNAYYSVVDAQTLQGVAGVVTDLSGTNAFYDVVDAQTLNAVAAAVTDISGTNAYYSVGDFQTLQGVAGVITDLSGTNAYYSVGDLQTLNAVAGVVTDISGTNAYYNVGDLQTLQSVTGVVTDLSGTNAFYNVVDAQTLQGVTGVVTDLSGTNAFYNVVDTQTLQAVSGVVTNFTGTAATITDLRTTNLFSTVVDTQELYAVTGVVTNFVGTSATVFDQFNVGVGGTILTAFYNFLPGNAGIASVGIGSANPQELLDVGGDARIGGNLNVVGILTAQNVTEFKFADDISSGFNGITTQFTLSTDGTNYLNSEITTSARLLISVGGIVQQPDVLQQVGYYISGGTDRTTDPITLNFAEAPRAGAAFFGIIYGLTIAPSVAYVTQETSIINAIIFG